MSKSDILENILLDQVLGAVGYTPAANVAVALYTVTPSDQTAGTEVSTSGTGYARITLANNTTNWPAASNGSKSNGTEILFASAEADWGTVEGFGIFDDAGTPRLLYWGDLAEPRPVVEGDRPRFLVGELTISED
jgi:hypothetical protein